MTTTTKPKHMGLYRAKLSCRIACDALEGKIETPKSVSPSEWALYNIAKALEEVSMALEELIEQKTATRKTHMCRKCEAPVCCQEDEP